MKTVIEKILNEYKALEYGYFKEDNSPFEKLNQGVSFVVPLSPAVVSQIDIEPTKTYFQHYRTTNSFIDSLSERLVLAIIGEGYNAAAVPASQSVDGYFGIYPHKTAALRAGLGYIGKSALFISEKYGPYVRLGTVFTNADLNGKACVQEDKCGECRICSEKCPAMAISGKAFSEGDTRENIFDARACSEYMKRNFQHIGRGSVCGICMKHCPKGRNV